MQVKQALHQGYEDDVDPPLSALAQHIKDDLTHEGYKHMMAVGELQLVEHASLSCRVQYGADLSQTTLLLDLTCNKPLSTSCHVAHVCRAAFQ